MSEHNWAHYGDACYCRDCGEPEGSTNPCGVPANDAIRDAELATLRRKLAEAEAELKKCGEAVMTYVETVKRKNREIWAAEADCAAMREALERAKDWIEHDELAHGRSFGTGNQIRAALTRSTGQAILDELVAARKVCEAAQRLVSHCLSGSMKRDAITDCESAIIDYRAARNANTGANQ